MISYLVKVCSRLSALVLVMYIMSLPAQAQLTDLSAPEKSDGAWSIEALQVSDNQAYYQAYAGSQAMLQRTLGWGWPSAKQTLEGNEDTMRFHVDQHAQKRAFSYVLREADHLMLRGAVFVDAVQTRVGLPDFSADDFQVEVTFWLNRQGQESEQAEQLVPQLRDWLASEWDIRSALFPVARSNEFALQQLERHGFERVTEDPSKDEILYSFRAR